MFLHEKPLFRSVRAARGDWFWICGLSLEEAHMIAKGTDPGTPAAPAALAEGIFLT